MSTIAFDQFALTRIADFARSLSRLHQASRRQLVDDDAIDREFNAVCMSVWGYTTDDFSDELFSVADHGFLDTLDEAHARIFAAQAGYDLMREYLQKAGLDLSGATQGDGAGGAAHFTPDFMVSYLAFMAKQPSFADFSRALPILGRDGTLAKIQKDSPAAGHVLGKTGTFVETDALNRGLVVNGKGLAGYLTTRDGRRLAFAIYANNVKVPNEAAVQSLVGQALGEIAAAAYDASR